MLNKNDVIYYYSTDITADTILLTDDEHRHCSKVTRRRVGDRINVTDGQGTLYETEIAHIEKHTTTLKKVSEYKTAPPLYRLGIAIAPTKNPARLEHFVEKVTEIGISEIYLTYTHRTEASKIKEDRLQRIMISAMKQSKNFYLPQLVIVATLTELIDKGKSFDQRFVAHCDNPKLSLLQQLKQGSLLIAIGPEGDFTEEEIQQLKSSNFSEVQLGQSRLRTETAGLVAAAWVAAFWNQ